MKTKIADPKTYFFSEGNTTLNNIHSYADKAVPALLEQMKKAGLEANGSMKFINYGNSDDMDKEFKLRITVPVKILKEPTDGFQHVTTRTFKCLSSDTKERPEKCFLDV